MIRDDVPLLRKQSGSDLSLFFATLCIVDIFGVFPVIALPRAIVQCGWLGIPLILVVFGFQIYTAVLLGKSWNIATTIDPHIFKKNRYPLAAVTELTLGRRSSAFVSVLLDLTIFGGGIPNLLVASQNLQLFGLKVSQQEFNLSFCYWLLVVGLLLCPVMWLGSPRDMKWIVSFSTGAVFITALLIWWSIVIDDRDTNFLTVPTSPSWDKFISGYGMLAFQFDLHPTVMTIQVDMKRPKEINKAIILSFVISGSLFAITAALAIWRYGGGTTANILQVVPPGAGIQAAILIAALQLCLSSAIGHSALFQHLEDHMRIQRSFGWKRCAMRSAVVFLGVALGESVPRFDILMALIGGTLTGPLVFILPPLMYAKARALRRSRSRRFSAPELISSGPERRIIESDCVFQNPSVHSRATHYGFRNADEDKDDGYSFIYYGNNDDMELNYDIEYENNLLEDGTFEKTDETVELTRSESLPIMIDAIRPSIPRPRTQNITFDIKKARNFSFVQKFIDWFGYCIVMLGILITVSSTYINIRNTIRFVKFIPPCIINATVNIPNSV